MIVFHTSYIVVPKPDTSHSRKALDFGQGFYVTLLREQAEKYGERFKLRGKRAFLNIFELKDDWKDGFIVKEFSGYNEEWLDYVSANRRLLPVERYDAVVGSVANDKIFRTIDLYFAGEISKEDALKRLKYEKPNNQICILSQELINKNLRFLKSEEI